MMTFLKKIRENEEFDAYYDGYSSGSSACVAKAEAGLGDIIKTNDATIRLYAKFYKQPKRKRLKANWIEGFKFGWIEFAAMYNSGDPKLWMDESEYELKHRLRDEWAKGRDVSD